MNFVTACRGWVLAFSLAWFAPAVASAQVDADPSDAAPTVDGTFNDPAPADSTCSVAAAARQQGPGSALLLLCVATGAVWLGRRRVLPPG